MSHSPSVTSTYRGGYFDSPLLEEVRKRELNAFPIDSDEEWEEPSKISRVQNCWDKFGPAKLLKQLWNRVSSILQRERISSIYINFKEFDFIKDNSDDALTEQSSILFLRNVQSDQLDKFNNTHHIYRNGRNAILLRDWEFKKENIKVISWEYETPAIIVEVKKTKIALVTLANFATEQDFPKYLERVFKNVRKHNVEAIFTSGDLNSGKVDKEQIKKFRIVRSKTIFYDLQHGNIFSRICKSIVNFFLEHKNIYFLNLGWSKGISQIPENSGIQKIIQRLRSRTVQENEETVL